MTCYLPTALAAIFFPLLVSADDALPFDSKSVQRLSLDGVPRSLSIRQGGTSWLGYDLERGTPFHVWTSPMGKPGLIVKGFVTESDGQSRFTDRSEATWRIHSGDGDLAGKLRYHSCRDLDNTVKLHWELRYDSGNLHLEESIPKEGPSGGGSPEAVVRVVEVTGLRPGQSLRPPLPVSEKWQLLTESGEPIESITTDGTFHLRLP